MTGTDFDELVRTALRDVSNATTEPAGLADRMLERDATPLAAHRRPPRWGLPLIAAAAVIALAITVALVALTHSDKTMPATQVPTTTQRPLPSPTPQPRPVLAGFHAADVSFAGSSGAALGDAKCPHSAKTDCPALIRTSDGGRTWSATHVPHGLVSSFDFGSCGDNGTIHGPCVDHVVLAGNDGYLWSLHEFYTTTDGGRSWTHEQHPVSGSPGALDVRIVANSLVVRLAPVQQCSAGCPGVIETARLGRPNWTIANLDGTKPGLYSSSLAVTDRGAAFLFAGATADSAQARLLRYPGRDGQAWTVADAHPCPNDQYGSIAAVGTGIAVVCNEQTVRVSPNPDTPLGHAHRLPGKQDVVVAGGSGHRLVAVDYPGSGPDAVYSSSDDGASWHPAATVRASGRLTFVSADDGYALAPNGTDLLVTTDGGASWHLQPFAG